MGENEDEQPVSRAVKFVGPDTIEGLAMPFGMDTDGEQFTPATDFCYDWFGKSGRPFLFEHGLDSSLKTDRIGTQVDYEQRDEGIWATVQLDRNRRYRKAVDQLINEGAFGFSSGAMQHLTRKNAKAEITRWPWVELSGTPIPAHPKTLGVHYVKSADFLARLEENEHDAPPALKAALEALDEWALTRDPDATLATESLDEKAGRVTAAGLDLREHVTAYAAMRAKAGRVLSSATRERLMSHPSLLRELADDLDGLLREADAPKEGKSADLWIEAIRTERALSRHLGLD